MFDLVIRHGTLIDGSGAPRRPADVAIAAGRVAEIGSGLARGREEIDARGRVVAPGFIDAHTHDDLALLVEPDMTCKISQGVTTCICGNCGVSLAPLPDGELPEPLNLLSTPGRPRLHRSSEFIDALRDAPAAVNSAPLLGHSSLRASVMSRTDRPATADEIAAMRALAQQALRAGFHGITTGTFYAAAAHATTREVIDVCAPLAELGGVYATHMRDEGNNVIGSLDETAVIARALGVQAIVSHHKVAGRPNHGRSRETLAHITALQSADGGALKLALDAYPYTAASTVLRADRVPISERTLITSCASHPEAVGRDAVDLAREWGLSIDALVERLRPAGATYFMMSEADVERILQFVDTMIGSDGIPGQPKPHPRLWGTFPRVLGHYCRERGLFSLEMAVHKMTGLPARRFGLVDRGLVAPGMAADVTVFDADTVIDRATFDAPTQAAQGITHVVVNGQLSWRDGRVVARAGRLLPRAGR